LFERDLSWYLAIMTTAGAAQISSIGAAPQALVEHPAKRLHFSRAPLYLVAAAARRIALHRGAR
jgi:hypothetical protein